MNDIINELTLKKVCFQVIEIYNTLVKEQNVLLRKPRSEADCMTESGRVDVKLYADLINLTIQRESQLPIIHKAINSCIQLEQLIKDLLPIIETEGNKKAYDHFVNSLDTSKTQQLEKILKTISLEEKLIEINSDLITYIFQD